MHLFTLCHTYFAEAIRLSSEAILIEVGWPNEVLTPLRSCLSFGLLRGSNGSTKAFSHLLPVS
jgi:hypothetical protein